MNERETPQKRTLDDLALELGANTTPRKCQRGLGMQADTERFLTHQRLCPECHGRTHAIRSVLHRWGVILPVLALLLVTGCGGRHLEIQSNTSWSAVVDGATVDGRGSHSFELRDDKCAVAQKETRDGFLQARIVNQGAVAIFWDRATSWKRTTTAYGVVDVCASDN